MKFVFFVEGHTEKRAIGSFLKRWLDPKLSHRVGIKVVRFEGWREMEKDMPKKAKSHLDGPDRDNIIAVLALLDLYGPTFYPADRITPKDRLVWGTDYLEKKVDNPRFRVFFAVHELEAWLLSQPEIFPRPVAEAIRKIPHAHAPEDVDFDAPPAKRLCKLYLQKTSRGYKKTTHGVQLFAKLDPDVAAQKCPELKRMLEAMLEMAKNA